MAANRPYPCRFGPYVLLDPLGSGGMGHVALAMSGEPGREQFCVVKRMLPHLLGKAGLLQRFEDEANLSRRLSHGCIVQTLATGVENGEPFIAQALVDGRDLSEVVGRAASQERSVPLALWIHIVREVCLGLSYAHDFEGLGLVHRDISPQNIRLTFSGEVKVMDFGLAFSKDKKALTAPGALLGRAAYMPPEQLAGDSTDRRTDIYSLGVVLWELLSGELFGTIMRDGKPVYAAEPRAALARAFKPNALPPSTFNPSISADLDAIVLRAVAADRNSRFASAAEMRTALSPFLVGDFDAETSLSELLRFLFVRDAELARRKELIESGRLLVERAVEDLSMASAPAVSAPQPTVHWLNRGSVTMGALVATAASIVVLVVLFLLRGATIDSSSPQKVAVRPSRSALPLPEPPSVFPDAGAPAQVALRGATRPVSGIAVAPVVARAPVPVHATGRVPLSPSAPQNTALDLKAHLAAAREAFLDGDFAKSLDEAQAAYRGGGGAEALLVIGNVHFGERRYREAQKAYSEGARLAPADRRFTDRLAAVREMLDSQ